jgi:hypothetical protein
MSNHWARVQMNLAESVGKTAAERRNVYSPRAHSLITSEQTEMLDIYKHFLPPALFSPVLVER